MDDVTWTIVAQARAANATAIADLYERYSEGLYRYVLLVSGDSELAEDLTGQAFLRWLDGSRRAIQPPTTAQAALYRTAHDLLAFQGSRQQRPAARAVPGDPAALGAALPQADAPAGFWEQFQAALTRLSDLPIQVLALKLGAGLSTAEVAWILGCREDEIKQAQLHALVQLRQWLSWHPAALPLEEQG